MTTPQGDLPDWLATTGATVDEVWSGTINPGGSQIIPVAQYNSIVVCLAPSPPLNPMACSYQWLDAATGVVIDAGLLSANITTQIVGGAGPSWVLPVRGGQVDLANNSASGMLVRVIGQPTESEWRMNHDGDPSRPFQGTIPANAAANSTIALPSVLNVADTIPMYPGVTSYNGQVLLSLTTAAGTNGAVEAVWPDQHGNLTTTPLLIDPGGGSRSQLVAHPRAYCTWQYRMSAVGPAAAHNAFLSVTPA